MRQPPIFHKNAPRKLVRLWRKYPAYYKIASYLKVNIATVWFALKKGKEPTNADIREKFGLPRKPRKLRTEADHEPKPMPCHLKWWYRLDMDIKKVYIKEVYEQWIAAASKGVTK